MKNFQFSLDPVLEYKQQVLDSLTAEHQTLLAGIRNQERVLAAAERRYERINQEYRGKKEAGMLIAEAVSYETGLKVLEKEILCETQRLTALRHQAEEKRAELVAVKQDASSIEKLRNKQLDGYRTEIRKAQEHFIDDLVCAQRFSSGDTL